MEGKIIIRYYYRNYKLDKYNGGLYYINSTGPTIDHEEQVYEGNINMFTDIDKEFNSISVKDKDYKIYPIEAVIPSTDGTITYYLFGGYVREDESNELYEKLKLEGNEWEQSEKDREIDETYRILTACRESKLSYKIAKLVKNIFK